MLHFPWANSAQSNFHRQFPSGFPGVFIRAPRFESVSVGAQVAANNGDEPVGVISGRRLALTFHPELTEDFGFHIWLLNTAMSRIEPFSSVESEA